MKTLAALFAIVWMSGGCATGAVFSSARRTEWPVEFQAAFVDDEYLWLRYRCEKRTEGGEVVATPERAVRLRLSELALQTPVGRAPVTRVEPGAVPSGSLRPVALVQDAAAAPVGEPFLLLYTQGDAHAGFRAQGLDHVEAGADFYADALVERNLTPLPLLALPLALVWDAATTPPLALFGVLVFAWGR